MIERDEFDEKEAARRRDEVVRHMANTPPQPKIKSRPHQEKKKKAGADHAAHRDRVDRER
ncbi:hypothetical protein [Hyphomicrobium denitrificans]|uniref:hypothetical protein n=1 Tax=Hyphomicrobium denitrificans TaxID=53399 RepID=UPI00059CF25A|nr:hypothetical protein [Hyphomicrobium denitrificans]